MLRLSNRFSFILCLCTSAEIHCRNFLLASVCYGNPHHDYNRQTNWPASFHHYNNAQIECMKY